MYTLPKPEDRGGGKRLVQGKLKLNCGFIYLWQLIFLYLYGGENERSTYRCVLPYVTSRDGEKFNSVHV